MGGGGLCPISVPIFTTFYHMVLETTIDLHCIMIIIKKSNIYALAPLVFGSSWPPRQPQLIPSELLMFVLTTQGCKLLWRFVDLLLIYLFQRSQKLSLWIKQSWNRGEEEYTCRLDVCGFNHSLVNWSWMQHSDWFLSCCTMEHSTEWKGFILSSWFQVTLCVVCVFSSLFCQW